MSENLAKQTDRYFCIDAVKAIAIVLVVFGHCLQYGSGAYFSENSLFFQNPAFKAIYSFHMPLFFAISGYLFFVSVQKRSFLDTLKSRTISLLVPVFCWSIIQRFFLVLIEKQNIDLPWVIDTLKSCLTNFWFLWTLFFCTCVVLLIRKLFRDHIAAYIVVLLLLQFMPNWLHLHYLAFMYPYFAGAYLLHKYHVLRHFKKKSIIYLTAGISFVAWLALLCAFREEHYIYTTGICILQNDPLTQLLINMYRYAVGVVGTIFVIALVSTITSPPVWLQKCCCFVGSRTLGVYILNTFFNIILAKLTVNMQLNYGWALVETIVIVLVALVITYVLEKTKITRRLLLGRS